MQRHVWKLALFSTFVFASAALLAQEKPGDEEEPPAAEKSDKPAAKSPKALFAELDKDEDGTLTSDEIPEEKKKVFEHALRVGDKDKNGKLSAEEFAEGFKAEKPRRANDRLAGTPLEMFKQLDADGDGKVTLAEVDEDQKDSVTRLLKQLGKDEDGEVTQQDFLRAFPTFNRPPGGIGPMPPAPIVPIINPEEMFTRLDKDKDGKVKLSEVPQGARERLAQILKAEGKDEDEEITREEFLKAARQIQPGIPGPPGPFPGFPELAMFTKMDTDGDGKITLDEVPEKLRDQATRIFKRAGKETDGELTKDEFSRTMMELARPDLRPAIHGGQRPLGFVSFPNPEGTFKKLDKDGDGILTAEEIPESMRGMAQALLRQAGKGSDDSLTLEDLKVAPPGFPGIVPLPPMPMPGIMPGGTLASSGLLRKLDGNKDGRLSKDELAKIADLFEELDLNQDGELDSLELFSPGVPVPDVGDAPRPRLPAKAEPKVEETPKPKDDDTVDDKPRDDAPAPDKPQPKKRGEKREDRRQGERKGQ